MRQHLLTRRSYFVGVAIAAVIAVTMVIACREAPASPNAAPDESRFTKRVLVDGLSEPIQLEFDSGGRVYWIERSSGNVRRLDESTGEVTLLGQVPTTVVAEGGLLGILLDREFESTRHIFFYYTYVGEGRAVQEGRLSRFTLGPDDQLEMTSEIVLLRFPVDPSGHLGGGMTWDDEGNLYLSVGDASSATQYGTFRFTLEGGAGQDAQRTSGSTNDLRGKILRIRPEPDGTYSIPEGNLFPPGTPDTRSEIYTMGNRNAWRLSVDSKTGFLHWGEIGPDSGRDSVGIGPMGYDEFNVAREAGNFGWPFFIGYNRSYNVWDYATETYGEPSDSLRPLNQSPNNTGLRELPPARSPVIAYPYGVSQEYPELASGGRAALGGPIFHRADFEPDAPRVLPAYYEGKWFVIDYVRNWIFVVTMSPEGDRVSSIERFAPELKFLNPLDMDFGPNGDLYVVEYSRSTGGKISKIEYNGGNRPPEVQITSDRTAGATPLQLALSSAGTVDHDGDDLEYEWTVTPEEGGEAQRFSEANPTVTLERAGAYRVALTARDPSGAVGTAETRIFAGNEPPTVEIDVLGGNRSFYFPGAIVQYRVSVSDREDGTIDPDSVAVTTEFVPSGLTPDQVDQVKELAPEAPARHLQAITIMAGSDCRTCHAEQSRIVGPSYLEVADRNRGEAGAAERLAQKIIAGGTGVWGNSPMPPHPSLTPVEATAVAEYVLSVGEADAGSTRVALQGTFAPDVPPAPSSGNNPGRVVQVGSYVMRAAYTDAGAPGAPPITSSDVVLLRQPKLAPEQADVISEGTHYSPSVGDPGFVILRSGAHIGYRGVDLTGVDSIAVGVLTRFYTWSHFIGGTVEVRLDSPSGPLVGEPAAVSPPGGPSTQAEIRPGPPPGAPTSRARAPNPRYQTILGANLEKPVLFPVQGIFGERDVFVVFRNGNAAETDALFLVTHVEFRPRSTGPDSNP